MNETWPNNNRKMYQNLSLKRKQIDEHANMNGEKVQLGKKERAGG
jgi:hypothetical protein